MAYERINFVDNVTELSAENLNRMDKGIAIAMPTGSIIAFCGNVAPEGWLICDGSEVEKDRYLDLFNILGYTFGRGDDGDYFGLPNLKGNVIVGLDSSQTEFDTIGKIGGSKEMQKHSHNWGAWAGGYDANGQYQGLGGFKGYGWKTVSGGRLTYDGGSGIQDAGTGESGNLQPYITFNYIIKY